MGAHHVPLSLGFSRQEYWSGLPFPPPMRESEIAQSCLTLRDPMDCSLSGSSVHRIFQAGVLEWVVIAVSNISIYNGPNPQDSQYWENQNVSYELWVIMMHQYRFFSCNKDTTLVIFLGGSDSKESAYNAEDLGSIPESGRSPGGRNGSPLQYSCQENTMGRGAWRATFHGVAESDMTEVTNEDRWWEMLITGETMHVYGGSIWEISAPSF